MKNVIFFGLFLLLTSACTPLKRAQTGITRGIEGSSEIKVGGHEVYCSQGRVCAEVEVVSIAVEDRDNGKVRVTLKNQTDNTALVQITLQIRSAHGEVLT